MGGFHLGLWSLSINTVEDKQVEQLLDDFRLTSAAVLLMEAHRLERPRKNHSPSAGTRGEYHEMTTFVTDP